MWDFVLSTTSIQDLYSGKRVQRGNVFDWETAALKVFGQVAHLGTKVGSISDVGEEEFRVTGSAERHGRAVLHCVVVDVFRFCSQLTATCGKADVQVKQHGPTDGPTATMMLLTCNRTLLPWPPPSPWQPPSGSLSNLRMSRK
ncbi:hypothetical protein INR49_011599 [Caranx melampygus]|nr:hypothetical protein INR49_011599 [Caranx melampygus]